MTQSLQREIDNYLSKKNPYYSNFSEELKKHLNNLYPELPIRGQWYLLKNNINDLPQCEYPNCENPVKWNERKNQLDRGCCKTHNQKITFIDKFGTEHPNQNKQHFNKIQQKIKDQTGYSFGENPEIVEKRRKTNIKKYGVEEIGKAQSIRDKIKQTNLERYGVAETMSVPEIRAKAKKTMIDRYGVETSLSNSEIRAKGNKTNLKKYGSIFPMKNEELLEKRRNTIIEKYDAYSPLSKKEIADKLRKTQWTKYYTNKLMNNRFVIPKFEIYEYVGTKSYKKYEWECKKCQTEFEDYISNGHMPRCPKCFPIPEGNISKSEQELVDYISTKINSKIRQNIRKTVCEKEVDIFIPDLKLAIEFDGMYWHSEQKGKDKYYHFDKTIESENNEIKLIHIFEPEWENKKEIVKSILDRELGVVQQMNSDDLIYDFIEVDIYEEFENENSLINTNTIGSTNIMIGGFMNNELIIAIKINKVGDHYSIENIIQRQGFKLNGDYLKKMLELAKLDDETIYIFLDRRYYSYLDRFEFELNGFSLEGILEPSMYYSKQFNHMIYSHNITNETISKYIQSNEIDTGLTIKENLELRGFKSVWDCGKLVFKKV